MPSAEGAAGAETENTEAEATESGPVDEARSALLEALTSELGDTLVSSHLAPGRDLWIRVSGDTWSDTADYLRNRQRFRFFDWLSAIDWMQSPFGRSLEAAVDVAAGVDAASAEDGDSDSSSDDADTGGYTGTGADGVTGGATRFQLLARVYSLSTGLGLNLKADVPDGDLSIGTWTNTYPGVAWHEREVHEMFGITFAGNNDMRNLYLPSDFEGHPLRKDFPLMARLVKPWPGIIDVEPMPSTDNEEADANG